MKRAEFLHADTNLGMLNVTLIIIGWGHPKMVLDHETQKSGVSDKWFD